LTALVVLVALAGPLSAADLPFEQKEVEIQTPAPVDPEVVMPNSAIGVYTFSGAAGTYTPLVGDTPFVINGGGGTLDDGYSATQIIPFPFQFGGGSFTQYRVNTNGWIGFGEQTVTGAYSALSSTTTFNVIAFCNRDLNNTGAVYSSVTEGVSPNQIHKIQAANFYRYNTATMTGNAQVWLYEGTNVVEIHYGAFVTTWTSGSTVQVGLKGGSTAAADVFSLAGTGATTWTNPTPGNVSTSTMSLALTVIPDQGRTFTFTPGAPAPFFATSTKAADQTFARNGDTVTYTIVVNNTGDAAGLGTTMSDPLPVGQAYVDGSLNTVGGSPAVYNGGTNAIEWGPEDLASGGTVTITYDVTITATPPSAPLANTATITATNNPGAPVTKTVNVAIVGGYSDGIYYCTDSLSPGGPVFNWYDATGGTLLIDASAGGDDAEANVTMPFIFTYYFTESADLRVGNNGAILFGATTGDVGITNYDLSNTLAPYNFIAPFWDDLDSDTGGVYAETFGTAPNRVFVVEWNNRPHYSNVGSCSFQVQFYEATNAIVFQYLDVDFGNALYNGGFSATVGIKGGVGSTPIQYSYNVACLQDNMAIRFWPDPTIPVMLSGFNVRTLGQSVELSWTSEAAGLAGWNLYRGRSQDNVNERVNATLIPMSSGPTFTYSDTPSDPEGGEYFYRLTAVYEGGGEETVRIFNATVQGRATTVAFALAGANPFRGGTMFTYALPTRMPVRIDVYDVAGRRVRTLVDRDEEPGVHTVGLTQVGPEGRLGAGVYLVRLRAGDIQKTVRVIAVH
jgi:uncharacterized repeat protein (TIGR01451 family)